VAIRIRQHRLVRVIAAVLLAVIAPTALALAQSIADFYKGRDMDLYIGYSTGGAYDFYARVIGRYMGHHIPGNPTLVPKNMEGAGSLRLANFLYRVAPHDGSALGTIGRGIAFDPLLLGQGDAFDAQKFSWIGSANNEVSVCVAMKDSGITKFEDLFTKELTVGGTGTSADTDQFPRVLNSALGTHFKIVEGYPGGNDVLLAMERGEVKGRCGWSWSSVKTTRKEWLDDKRMVVLVQLSLTKHPEMPDVPLVTDFAKTDEQRAILKLIFARNVMGRPYVAPPNLPPERLATLRQAFMDTMKDKDFLAEADKAQLEINPVSGEDVEKLVKDVYATPADIIAKTKAAAASN
jgi:tripartite-type tricarboxylate transporter receptor subunit TctC